MGNAGIFSESRFGSTPLCVGALDSLHPFLLCFWDDLGELFWYCSLCLGAHDSSYPLFYSNDSSHNVLKWISLTWISRAFWCSQFARYLLINSEEICLQLREGSCFCGMHFKAVPPSLFHNCNPLIMGSLWYALEQSFCYGHLSIKFIYSFMFTSLTH